MRGTMRHAKIISMKKNVFLIKRSEPPLGVDTSKGIIYLDPEEVLSALSDLIYMNPTLHSCFINKGKRYVKISSAETGKSIYRIAEAITAKEFTDEMLALNSPSIHQLGLSKKVKEDGIEVEISKTNFLKFYWNHPFHATKISMRIGLISAVIGALSLIISIMPLF